MLSERVRKSVLCPYTVGYAVCRCSWFYLVKGCDQTIWEKKWIIQLEQMGGSEDYILELLSFV